MKSTFDISTRLTRYSDTGNISTSFAYVEGMPPMLVIKQKNSTGSTQVVELTMSETHVFQYVLGEIYRICQMVEHMDDKPKSTLSPEMSYGRGLVDMLTKE